jgi:hypothetical protein
MGVKNGSVGPTVTSALPQKAEIDRRDFNVRLVPNNRLMRRSKRHLYSITSSVRASSIGERSTRECLRSLEIDDQLKFVRKFDRQVTRLGIL